MCLLWKYSFAKRLLAGKVIQGFRKEAMKSDFVSLVFPTPELLQQAILPKVEMSSYYKTNRQFLTNFTKFGGNHFPFDRSDLKNDYKFNNSFPWEKFMPKISLFLGVRYKVGTFSICLCHFYEGTYWHWLIGLIRDEKPLTWKCIKVWRCNTTQQEVLRLLLCENYYPYLFVVKVYQLIRIGLVGEELYRPQLKTDLWNQSKNEACGHHTLIIFLLIFAWFVSPLPFSCWTLSSCIDLSEGRKRRMISPQDCNMSRNIFRKHYAKCSVFLCNSLQKVRKCNPKSPSQLEGVDTVCCLQGCLILQVFAFTPDQQKPGSDPLSYWLF